MVARTPELDGSTVTADRSDSHESPAHPFPIPGWDRYACVKFLGQGAMGKVFLAHDPRLRRLVAIKFVHGNDPDHIRRLIAEARAQARVNHERVCKVHEVGEVDGKVYIAMEYIDGRPLAELGAELTTEQKVMIVREAAEGIHEAHRAGIIHRDVKPSNILVERSEDGKLRPYVMDFGLARSIQEDGGTLSGTVLGTPRYMAPEQAQGEVGTLDRRADVYSLGATLYYLATGEPPIPGSTPLEVMHNVLTRDPRAPRALRANIAPDLEAIILKCLEKDRTARYDSARALAEDLGHFLDGDPVSARATGAVYRLRKWLAKHRLLVGVFAAAVVLALGGAGWGLHTANETTALQEFMRSVIERLERVESRARFSALSRIHDIRGDQAALRTELATLEREVQEAGDNAAGAGHYALGRGYLAIGDDAKAREYLDAAWRDGFREPRVAYALALVMGHLYQQHVLAADRLEQKSLRLAKRTEAEKQYRDPARVYIAAARGVAEPSADYAAALLAFYAGDNEHLDEALHRLDAIKNLPWFYEALELRGDILFSRARRHSDSDDLERARADYEAARQAYAAAAHVGESSISAYRSLANLELSEVQMNLYRAGDVRGPFERGVAAATRALQVVPDDDDTLVICARLRRNMAAHDATRGLGVDELLDDALRDAQRAIEVSAARPQARMELAAIYRQRGEVRVSRGLDPRDELAKAIAAADAVPTADRDALFFNNTGLVFKIRADYEDQVGANSETDRARAIQAYTRALELDDQLVLARGNLGINYFMRASQTRTANPGGDLDKALEAFELAKRRSPKNYVLYLYRGRSFARKAELARGEGGDPTPLWKLALAEYHDGIAVNATPPVLSNVIGITRMAQAKYEWDRGRDPGPLLTAALDAFQDAIRLGPEQGLAYGNAGDALIARAAFQRAGGDDPSAAIDAAVHRLREAFQRLPANAAYLADLGMAYAVLGGYQLDHRRDPTTSLRAGLLALEQALARNPNDAQAQNYLGETRALLARLHAQQHHGRAEDFDTAAEAFRRARELAPDSWEFRIAFARFCGVQAAFQRNTGVDPRPTLMQGTDAVERILAVDPALPDALLTRASLRVLGAALAPSGAERTQLRMQAEADRARALEINPRLATTWKQLVAVVGQATKVP